jgi:predicted nucleic acid-binding protein
LPDPYKKPYLDSNVFISLIQGEKVMKKVVTRVPGVDKNGKKVTRDKVEMVEVDRTPIVQYILRAAQRGDYEIYTSTLTWAEVHRLKGEETARTLQEDETILQFLQNSYIVPIEASRLIGEEANRLCRKFGIYPMDAIHLASALSEKCDVLLAWDDRFTKKVKGLQGIRLEEPQIIGQLKLDGV